MQAKRAASPPLTALHPKRGGAAVRKASLKSGLVKPICCYVASGTPDTGVLGRENPSVSGLSAPSKRSYRRASAARTYAAEELAAAFLCVHLGITGELRHAGYIVNSDLLISMNLR